MAKWVQKAFSKNPGKLHRRLGVPEGEKIPTKKLEKAEHSKDPSLRKEAALAETAKHFKHKGKVDRSSHHDGNPGFPSSEKAGQSPPPASYAASPYKHIPRAAEPRGHGYGHDATRRSGCLRMSGHAGAHRIGKR